MAFFHVGRWTTVEVAAAAVEAEVAFFGQKNENSLTFFLALSLSLSHSPSLTLSLALSLLFFWSSAHSTE